MTVSAAVRLIPSPPALVLSKKRCGAPGRSPPFWNIFICSRRSRGGVDPSMRQIFHPINSHAQSYETKHCYSESSRYIKSLHTSMMSSIVVNWLNNSTLCFRLNSSRNNRSRTIIFPLTLTRSSLRAGWSVTGSNGQSNRNGCEHTLRSCITVF